jgi:hypothetical protein
VALFHLVRDQAAYAWKAQSVHCMLVVDAIRAAGCPALEPISDGGVEKTDALRLALHS